MVFRVGDFDDFLDCARVCQLVFFMGLPFKAGMKIVAHAGRVHWVGVYPDEKQAEQVEDELKNVGAKEILENIPQEQVKS